MPIVSFFNNKGGVGKTTLACNLAAVLAKRQGIRVLLVDCDPQCNATLLVLGEDEAAPNYWDESQSKNKNDTLLTVVEPLEHGEASINTEVQPVPADKNRFGVDLLPGHPRLSMIEDRLSQAWRDSLSGDSGGLRRTNWCHALLSKLAGSYDLILLDLGPSLGSINRTALLASDYFCTPMGADIFSIIGLRNIGDWLGSWSKLYDRAIANCDSQSPGAVERFEIRRSLSITHGYAGYTVQSYIAKYRDGERRPTKAYDRILANFPNEVRTHLGPYFPAALTDKKAKLGDIPNMFSIVPLAQSASAPIIDLTAKDGILGAHYSQAQKYITILEEVAGSLSKNIGLGVVR